MMSPYSLIHKKQYQTLTGPQKKYSNRKKTGHQRISSRSSHFFSRTKA